jgi:hypothetical protein
MPQAIADLLDQKDADQRGGTLKESLSVGSLGVVWLPFDFGSQGYEYCHIGDGLHEHG